MPEELRKDMIIESRLREHLNHYLKTYPNDWVGIFLQGSQNYGLDYENSDIDTKIIILPSLEDIALNKQPISTTLVMPNDEHVDVKDIRLMFDCFKKQNINFLEILFTKWNIVNPKYDEQMSDVFIRREEIAHYSNYAALHCMLGMVNQKRSMLMKPHPSAVEVVKKYGYDGKQLHHMERILEFFYRYTNGVPYEECLISQNRDYLISLKKQELPLHDAVRRADEIVDVMTDDVEAYKVVHDRYVNHAVEELLNKTLVEVMKRAIESEVKDGLDERHEP